MESDIKRSAINGFVSLRIKRIVFVLFAFCIFHLVSYILDPYSVFWDHYFQRPIYLIAIEWTIILLFCSLISESSLQINRKLNSRIPWIKNRRKRLIIELCLNFIVVVVLIMLNMLCFNLIYTACCENNIVPTIDEIRGLLQWIVTSVVISFMIITIHIISFLVNSWVNASTEMARQQVQVAEMKQASVEAELSALRMQLDPHFIFNNLSVLSELILENQQLGFEYSENFAKVYRFLLVNGKKNLITLEEEIKFLYAYIFLIQHRVGTGVQFDLSIDNDSTSLYIPPLTLQLLIENAIKHNRTNRKNPLRIRIYNINKNKIVVENSLAKITGSEIMSTGIGLKNIIERFKLIGYVLPEVVQTETLFSVTIHLIDYDPENSNCRR